MNCCNQYETYKSADNSFESIVGEIVTDRTDSTDFKIESLTCITCVWGGGGGARARRRTHFF